MRLIVPGESTTVEKVGRFGLIYQIEAPRAPLNPDYRLVLPHRYLFPRTALQRIINREQPDLIEISDKYTVPYLGGLLRTRRLPGVSVRPTVIGLSHERMDENAAAYISVKPAVQRFCEWYMKWAYFPMFDHHVTISEHTAEELIRASRGHKVRRGIWVAPMGVDCDRFHPARRSSDVRRELLQISGGDEHTTLLLYAGRLAPEKNLELLIETAARLDASATRLLIFGSGIQQQHLQRECADRGLRHVVFGGHVADRNKLADYFANSDIFVHPNAHEPFGIAPLEAMASGLPLIAPNAGGVTSYANASNAWLAEPTAKAFAHKIELLQADPAARLQKAHVARQTAEAHSWDRITSRYLQLYRELHAATVGERPTETIAAYCYSTPGDARGRELARF